MALRWAVSMGGRVVAARMARMGGSSPQVGQCWSAVAGDAAGSGREAVGAVGGCCRGFAGSATKRAADVETIDVVFIDRDGQEVVVPAVVGESMLEAAHENEIELEGACEGSLACSTCHVILEQDVFDSLEEPCDDENDMLDLAFGLTETSRLGCQIIAAKGMEGMKMKIPNATRNMAVDGFVPKPH